MEKLDSVYISEKLFPLFANRILPKSRPEYRDYLRWLGLSNSDFDELDVLARSGGIRETDTLEIFPCPIANDKNLFEGFFFSHGLRYLTPENRSRINTLQSGEQLYLVRDVQNKYDPTALLLRTGDPISFVGYCPRYFSAEFCDLMDRVGQHQIMVRVERVNLDAPSDLRLLCKIFAPWPKRYAPFSRGAFKVLAKIGDRKEKMQWSSTRALVKTSARTTKQVPQKVRVHNK
jgi:hypothetical protein